MFKLCIGKNGWPQNDRPFLSGMFLRSLRRCRIPSNLAVRGSKREQARRRKNNKSLQCRQASILGSKRRRKNNKSLVTNEKGGAWLALAAKLLQHTLHLPQYNLINQSNNECNMSLWSVYTIQCDNSIVVGCVAVHCQTSLSNGTHSRWPG